MREVRVLVVVIACVLLAACLRSSPPVEPGEITNAQSTSPSRYMLTSYYGEGFSGKRTASGETFNPSALTAAHRTLRFGTRIRVTDPASNKSVVVRVNDRGPFIKGRELDISQGAAERLGMTKRGVLKLKCEIIR